jgi:hypothetical protein
MLGALNLSLIYELWISNDLKGLYCLLNGNLVVAQNDVFSLLFTFPKCLKMSGKVKLGFKWKLKISLNN